VPGLSDNIRVTSIVGRFLEHSRIFCFANGGAEEVYLGSADLMERNLDRRVEALFPVLDPLLVEQIREGILRVYQADNVKSRFLQADGSYLWPSPNGDEQFNSQQALLEHRVAVVL
jgi:polyphosphate kinase